MVTEGTHAEAAVAAAAATDPPGRRSRHRIRRVLTWVLVVVVAVLVPLSVISAWSVKTVTSTEDYVTTMAPLVRQKVITDYVAAAATTVLFDKADVQQRIEKALPKKADFIAAPVTVQLRSFVTQQVTTILNSNWFHTLWDQLNRRSQALLLAFLTGNGQQVKKLKSIGVNVTPVLDKAITTLDQHGVTVFDPLKKKLASGNLVSVPVARQQQVAKIRGLFKLVTKAGWALLGVTLVLAAAALMAAVDRRKTGVRLAMGGAIGCVVILLALSLGRSFMVSHTASRVDPQVTGAVFDTVVRFLRMDLRWVTGLCVLVALVLWFAGPSRWARGGRRGVAGAWHWMGRRVRELNTPEHRAAAGGHARTGAAWALEHRSGLRIVGAVVAAAVILLGGNLSPDGVLWTLIGLAIFYGLLELVLLWARRAAPGAGPGDGAAEGGHRDDPPGDGAAEAEPASAGRGGPSPG